MDPKTFLAFGLGCLMTGGAAYYLTRLPAAAPVVPVAASAAAPMKPAEPEVPVTPDRIISTAGKETTPALPVEAPVVKVNKPSGFARIPAAKPAPAAPVAKASVAAAEAPVAAKPIPAVNPVVTPEPAVVVVNPPLKAEIPPPPPPAPTVVAEKAPAPPPAPKANTVTLNAGTLLSVRLQESLSSERNKVGDTFRGTLDQPVIIDGFVIAEKGSRVEGRVADLDRSGRVKGVARLVLELSTIHTSDGQQVRVQTSSFERKGESSKKSDAAKVGIGAAIGAVIGGIAGGGKGAAAGAGVGGAAGAGDVLLTRGKAAELSVESRLSFRLQEPVTLTERLNN